MYTCIFMTCLPFYRHILHSFSYVPRTFTTAGKDMAWASNIKSMWIIFVIPTLVIAFDFVLLTLMSKVCISYYYTYGVYNTYIY